MTLTPINPATARRLQAQGALLVDLREEAEQELAPLIGALQAPLSELPRQVGSPLVPAVIFICSNGAVAAAQAERLARVSRSRLSFFVEGGLAAWDPKVAARAPMIDRRPFLVFGTALLLSYALSHVVSHRFHDFEVLLGLALLLAGLTGRCTTMRILRRAPWNRHQDQPATA